VAEGDWVNYGDELFDLRVEEGLGIPSPAPGRESESYVQHLVHLQESLASLTDEDVMAARENPEDHHRKGRVNWFLRVTASDTGRLRRRLAGPGEEREFGDVLALLTTEEGEPAEPTDLAVRQASVFRTVVTPMPLWHEEA
jgi:hypothetical protein